MLRITHYVVTDHPLPITDHALPITHYASRITDYAYSHNIKVKKEDILTTDGIFAVVGFALGLFITSLNLIYSNNYLISLGPILAIASLLHLRFRTKILTNGTEKLYLYT